MESGERFGIAPVVALIAHDAKKDDLVRLIRSQRRLTASLEFVATASTGRCLLDEFLMPMELVAPGRNGGDSQIAARIIEGDIDAVVFLNDPYGPRLQEPDVRTLLRVCDVHQVPIATNVASAEILLHFIGGVARRREMQGLSHPSVASGPDLHFPRAPGPLRVLRVLDDEEAETQ